MENKSAYKGVRDFPPSEFNELLFFMNKCRDVSYQYGYQEYNTSVIEQASLYSNKTSEEIVNRQMYAFADKGGTNITLRPEITPQVARMIAGMVENRTFNAPLRWFSIPNLFRYEHPQKGRKREHWQFNADIFGVKERWAEAEIIEVALSALSALQIPLDKCEVLINDRGFMEEQFMSAGIEKNILMDLFRAIDRKGKVEDKEWRKDLENISPKALDVLEGIKDTPPSIKEIKSLIDNTQADIKYSQYLARGFDYYTGAIFEIFYKDKDLKARSLAGGGRYDNLIATEKDSIPAVGFGMGDVMVQEVRKSIRAESNPLPSPNTIIVFGDDVKPALKIAKELRENRINTSIEQASTKKTFGKIAKQYAETTAQYIIDINAMLIRNLKTREEKTFSDNNEMVEYIKENI